MSDITIIRAPRGKENPYFMHRRATAQDSRLSFEARGVMSYLLSKPDDWEIELPDLMNEGGIGRDKTRRILEEMRSAGYLLQEQPHGEKGKFEAVNYRLYEVPQPVTEKPSAVQPLTEKPSTVQPLTVQPSTANPHHTYKEILQNRESLQNTEETESATADSVDSTPREVDPPTPPAAAAVAEIIHSDFFETALKGFSLDGPLAAQLRARSELDGLALMLQATKGAKTSAPGLLMSLLRAEVSPNAEALRLAPLALELETLDWSELEQTARHREFEQTQAATWAIYQEKEATEPNAGESAGAVEDEPVDRNVEQARRVWSIAKGQLSIQLNRTTYDAWVARVEAQSYADNVLTLHAPNAYARDFLVKRMLDTLEHNARVAVGLDDLRVEVVA